jgi:hypothetical protein
MGSLNQPPASCFGFALLWCLPGGGAIGGESKLTASPPAQRTWLQAEQLDLVFLPRGLQTSDG